jgi:O-antigen ligase
VPPGVPPAGRLLRICVFLAFAGVAVLEPGGPVNTAGVDLPLVILLAVGVLSMTLYGSRATSTLAKAAPWLWLMLLGSLLGLAHVGLAGWALISMLRTSFIILTFFSVWHIVQTRGLRNVALAGATTALIIDLVGLVAVEYKYRASAFFPNPNYAGHFGVLIGVVLLVAHPKRWVKIMAAVAIGATIWVSASFGAIAMAGAMGAYAFARQLRRSVGVLVVGLTALIVVGGMYLFSPQPEVETKEGRWEVSGVISEDRFDRSSGSRTRIWSTALEAYADSPLGLGPNGDRYRNVYVGRNGQPVEVHSDPLGFLVERGVIGLVGLVGLVVVLWRAGTPYGLTRVVMVGIIAQGLFRETIHYRHMWLGLVIALLYDHQQARQAAGRHPTARGSPDRPSEPHPLPPASS